MQKTIIFILLLLFASCVAVAQAYELGYHHIGSVSWGDPDSPYQWINNYTLSVPSGYALNVSDFHGYVANSSADKNVHFAIYDMATTHLWAETANISVNGAGWYTGEIDVVLPSGNYYLVTGCDKNVSVYWDDYASIDARIVAAYNFPVYINAGAVAYNRAYSMYVDYEYVPLVDEPTSTQDVNWMAFVVLIAFAFLNVVLMLVPRLYLLNFVVGALTLAFAAATVNDSTLPIQPYFSLIVALLSVLGILRAANLLRNQ